MVAGRAGAAPDDGQPEARPGVPDLHRVRGSPPPDDPRGGVRTRTAVGNCPCVRHNQQMSTEVDIVIVPLAPVVMQQRCATIMALRSGFAPCAQKPICLRMAIREGPLRQPDTQAKSRAAVVCTGRRHVVPELREDVEGLRGRFHGVPADVRSDGGHRRGRQPGGPAPEPAGQGGRQPADHHLLRAPDAVHRLQLRHGPGERSDPLCS